MAVSLSDGMECPHCHTRLEVAAGSRTVASAAGLLAGWVAWHFTSNGTTILDMVLPELYAILAFGFVSALVMMFVADLQLAPLAPAIDMAAAPSHGGGHH